MMAPKFMLGYLFLVLAAVGQSVEGHGFGLQNFGSDYGVQKAETVKFSGHRRRKGHHHQTGHGNKTTGTKKKATPTNGPFHQWALSLDQAMALVGDGRSSFSVQSNSGKKHKAAPPPKRPRGASSGVTVNIKMNSGRYPINRAIYGVNEYQSPSPADLMAAGIRLVRKGGNKESRFNPVVDATNTGADWFFENLPDSYGGPSSFDFWFTNMKNAGIMAVATVPIMGWLPKSNARGCSYSVQKYGQQQKIAPDITDCGNGVTPDGKNTVANDPHDTGMPVGPLFHYTWIKNNTKKYGSGARGGVPFYSLDNEPVWWSYNHRDIHPAASSYDDIVSRGIAWAQQIKLADPTALITGPVSGGWSDVFYSAKDMQSGWSTAPWNYWSNPIDRNAHGGVPFLQYYLNAFKAFEIKNKKKILDFVDIHAYVVNFNDNTDPASQAQRISGTRIYWDPNFTCSFCGWVDPVTAPNGVPMFLTRVKNIIDSTYPGLGLAVTEYSFGGNNDISGAIAQAEALGLFGRLNVSMAAVFPGPAPTSTVYMAFKMFGNYDGMRGMFGDMGVSAITTDNTRVSAYAAINKFRYKLTVLVINLTPDAAPVTINFLDFTPPYTKKIKVYRYDSTNLQAIRGIPALPARASVTTTYPGYSLTMLEVPLP